MDKVHNLLSGSLLYRWLTIAANWVDRQWSKSYISLILTGQRERNGENSIFGKIGALFHRFLCAVFSALRLDKALDGSIFTRSFFWCCLTVTLAPIIPTMLTLCLCLVSIMSVTINFGMDKKARIHYSPINKWIWMYAFIYLVCTFTSATLSGSLQSGALVTAFILFSILLQNAIKTRKQINTVIYLLILGGFIVSLYGFFQVLTGVESTKDWIDEDTFSSLSLRVYSTLDNPNVLGEYLLLVIPLGVSSIVTAKTSHGKVAAGVATAAMGVCMILTYSRGGWLGLLFSAAIFLVLLDRRFIVLGVVAFACLPFVMPESILARFSSITDMSDSSTSYRIYIWMATVNMLKDYWFCGIGTGLNAFNAVYPAYSFNAVTAPHSHNLYLQVMCESGICGIVTFLGIIFSFIRTVGTSLSRDKNKDGRIQKIALLSGLGGFLLQGMTDYSFYNYRVTLMFWIFIALGACLSGMKDGSEVEKVD